MTLLKIMWGCLIHLDVVALLVLSIGFAGLCFTKQKWPKGCIGFALLAFALVLSSPLAFSVLTFLENQHPSPQTQSLPPEFKGFILLGSQFDKEVSSKRNSPVYSLAGGTLIDFGALVREHPDKPIVFTGTRIEIESAKTVFKKLDLKADILYVEAKNTYENAYNTCRALHPQQNETWVLITNAFHMTRSLGLFEGAGCKVLPYPIGYYTKGVYTYSLGDLLGYTKLAAWKVACTELAGLVNNYLEGYSPYIFPSKQKLSKLEGPSS